MRVYRTAPRWNFSKRGYKAPFSRSQCRKWYFGTTILFLEESLRYFPEDMSFER